MLIKKADEKTKDIETLKSILECSGNKRSQVEFELRICKAGIKAETDAAYQLDFHFEHNPNWAVIHGLRLEYNNRVAQIDHLLINRLLQCFVFETKSCTTKWRITDEGEFLREYKGRYKGMDSPIEQLNRHIIVLKDVFDVLDMPSRLGMKLTPSYHPFVLVSSGAEIERSMVFDSSNVAKIDAAITKLKQAPEGAIIKAISQKTLKHIADQLAALHRPKEINYSTKYGL